MAILGNDMAKKTFDVTLIDELGQKHKGHFTNNQKGFRKLQAWLVKRGVKQLHACLEATNVYWEELAEYLSEQGYQVSVVNPARIKGFAQSQMRRNKTDPEDSDTIADFCAVSQPRLWQPPTPEQRKLRALSRHREALQKTLTQQTNRLQTSKDQAVQTSLQLLIDTLQTEMSRLDAQIESLIEQQAHFQTQYRLLCSITGIGPRTAITLMAEMPDLAQYESARAAAADAGLTPSHYQSGTSVRRRAKMSKEGKIPIRAVLYWPSITAIRHNPIVRDLAERLQARGKAKKVIIGAAMRKLIHLAYGVLKNQTPFDPTYAR